jgi:CMP-N-acetylneuraminic acid synthetase
MSEQTIAMIPARIGSTRLKMKNLALIAGKPMIAYAIEAAKQAGCFSRIVLNGDHAVFASIAERYGIDFYLRPEALGSSDTKSDHVVKDFMQAHPADVVAWVNPTSPLQTGEEITSVISYFREHNCDSLFTVEDRQVHGIYQSQALNYQTSSVFAQTQELTPIQCFVYSIMMWRTEPFLAGMAKNGFAFFTGNVGFCPVSRLAALVVKNSDDLRLADYILKAREMGIADLEYDGLVAMLEG